MKVVNIKDAVDAIHNVQNVYEAIISELRDRLKKSEDFNSKLKDNNESLMVRNVELLNILNKHKSEQNNKQLTVKDIAENFPNLTVTIDSEERGKVIHNLKNQVKSLEAKLKKLRGGKEQAFAELEERNKKLTIQNNELHKKVAGLLQIIDDYSYRSLD